MHLDLTKSITCQYFYVFPQNARTILFHLATNAFCEIVGIYFNFLQIKNSMRCYYFIHFNIHLDLLTYLPFSLLFIQSCISVVLPGLLYLLLKSSFSILFYCSSANDEFSEGFVCFLFILSPFKIFFCYAKLYKHMKSKETNRYVMQPARFNHYQLIANIVLSIPLPTQSLPQLFEANFRQI